MHGNVRQLLDEKVDSWRDDFNKNVNTLITQIVISIVLILVPSMWLAYVLTEVFVAPPTPAPKNVAAKNDFPVGPCAAALATGVAVIGLGGLAAWRLEQWRSLQVQPGIWRQRCFTGINGARGVSDVDTGTLYQNPNTYSSKQMQDLQADLDQVQTPHGVIVHSLPDSLLSMVFVFLVVVTLALTGMFRGWRMTFSLGDGFALLLIVLTLIGVIGGFAVGRGSTDQRH